MKLRSCAAVLMFACLLSPSLSALDLLVYTLNDTGPGSLRQAIQDNNNTGGSNIIFSNTVAGTITLASGELPVIQPVRIFGPGSSLPTVSGNNLSRGDRKGPRLN